MLAASNYYFRDKIFVKAQLDIVRTGNRSKRKSACRRPYAEVFFNGIEKQVLFPCDFERTIANYSKVNLDLSEGLLGFYVIEKRELVR